jgi:hypothetical protein
MIRPKEFRFIRYSERCRNESRGAASVLTVKLDDIHSTRWCNLTWTIEQLVGMNYIISGKQRFMA